MSKQRRNTLSVLAAANHLRGVIADIRQAGANKSRLLREIVVGAATSDLQSALATATRGCDSLRHAALEPSFPVDSGIAEAFTRLGRIADIQPETLAWCGSLSENCVTDLKWAIEMLQKRMGPVAETSPRYVPVYQQNSPFDLPKILDYASVLKRAIDASADGLDTFASWQEFKTWQKYAGQSGEPLTIQAARMHACNDLYNLLRPIEGVHVSESIDLPRHTADALLALRDSTRGAGVHIHVAAKKDAIKQAIEKLVARNPNSGNSAETGQPVSSKTRMTVAKANEKTMNLARKMRAGFFALSERQQSELIGCSWKTWTRTPFFQKAKERRPAGNPRKPPSPKTEALTAGREAVTGEGDKDEVLQQLIAEQEANKEPSPLENDTPNRTRKIHSRKRL